MTSTNKELDRLRDPFYAKASMSYSERGDLWTITKQDFNAYTDQLATLIKIERLEAEKAGLQNIVRTPNIELMKPKKPFVWGVDTWTHQVPVVPRMFIDDRIAELTTALEAIRGE